MRVFTKQIITVVVIFFAVSCENPLEDRINELENKLEQQEKEQNRQQEILDSLLIKVQGQNATINSLIASRQRSIDSLIVIFNQSLDSLSSQQNRMIDSLIAEQNALIDSLYTSQQSMIEDILASQVNSDFIETEIFNGVCPQTWTDIDVSDFVGKKKTLLIFRIDRLSEKDEYIVFRPNGETADWLSDDPLWIIYGTSSLSVTNLGWAESALIMVNSDDAGIVEMRANIKNTIRVRVSLQFFIN